MNYAETASHNIKKLAREHNLSITQLAEKIGLGQTTLNSGLKSKKGISIESLIKIADYFGTTVPALCGRQTDITDSKPEPLVLLTNLYDNLNEEGQQKLLDYANDLVGNPRYQKETQLGLDLKDA